MPFAEHTNFRGRGSSPYWTMVSNRPRHLLVRSGRDGDRVHVTVRDAGVGFERQSIDKLFDAF